MDALRKIVGLTLLGFLSLTTLRAQENRPVLDIQLSNYIYPFPVDSLLLPNNQGKDLYMYYMDIKPKQNPNGEAVLLLHGKNFNGAYWKTTVDALRDAGYRVIVPDQIGFGKSSKPAQYQFTFQQLAMNTDALLNHVQVPEIHVLGHSMGGMLATRYALMYPEKVKKLILENPIGLEDWKLYAPYQPIDKNYASELKADYASTKKYQMEFYYDNQWKAAYDEWVYLLTGWVNHPDYPRVAWNNAQTSDMIFTQPVLYEFEHLSVPTLLVIGTRDGTAIGKDRVADPKVRAKMGQYQELGKETQKKIPGAALVELENVGHLPHIEAFERFMPPVLEFLKKEMN